MATNLAAVASRCADIQTGQFKKASYYKPKEGVNLIRILPPFGEREVPWVEFKKVFGIGPNKSAIVPRAQFGHTDCPFESHYNAVAKRTDEASRKELETMRQKNRVSFIIIDRNNEAVGPQVWEVSLEVLADVGALMTNPEWGDISDATNGVDLTLVYTPKGKTPNGFAETRLSPQRHSSPLSASQATLDEWLSVDWFKEFRVGEASTVGYIQAVFAGQEKEYFQSRERNTETDGSELGPQSLPVAGEAAPYPYAPTDGFFVLLDGAAKQVTAQQVFQLVCSGNDVQCCKVGDTSWASAGSLGFSKPQPVAPPPAPVAPSIAMAPPVPSSNGQSYPKEAPPWENIPPTPAPPAISMPGNSEVADDIRRQLVGSK